MTEYSGVYPDKGKKPFVVNIEDETLDNTNFRTTIWTGEKLQLTVMTIPAGECIGLEVHEGIDQFLRVEKGQGLCQMGASEDELDFEAKVSDDDAIFVPAGVWHNVTNTGEGDLKLYTIYAGPDHEPGTVHETKEDAENDPHEH